jgi:glucose/arabinose dehydrogenase
VIRTRLSLRLPLLLAIAIAVAVAYQTGALRRARAASPPKIPTGFALETIAHVEHPRELVETPNGDLLVGTSSRDVVIVARAEGSPLPAVPFARLDDAPAAGVALGDGALFVGSQFGIWKVPYRAGDTHARDVPVQIAKVRGNGGGGHSTTTVAVAGERLYASVGSSCNVCTEKDPTRATVQTLALDGSDMHPIATHIRNAVALAVDPATHAVWAGVAGQDELAHGHPYEIFDPVTDHGGVADYGWPTCYENHRAVAAGTDCDAQVVPRVVFPAYETPIGAAFYPADQAGPYAFPSAFRGGAFVTLHGSWHQPPVPPRVVFVPLRDDRPIKAVDWDDPSAQWTEFASGFQFDDGSRGGRPTGIAVGRDGSLFIADDYANAIYRVRPIAR